MRFRAGGLFVLLITPLLSSCLTSAAVLYAAMEADAAKVRHETFEVYHHPARDAFAEDGAYAFDGPFGSARLTVADGRATVELDGCAAFSGTLGEGGVGPWARYVWDLDEPQPPWSRVRAMVPEDLRVLGPDCASLRKAERIQMVTAYKGPDRGGYGSALFVQGLQTPPARFFSEGEQVFAKAFGAP